MNQTLVAGVDTSAAKEATGQTWLAVGRLDGLGLEVLELKKIGPHQIAAELSGPAQLKAAGLNFPFSLPADFIEVAAQAEPSKPFQSWQEVVEHFVFKSLDDYLAMTKQLKKESKRLTDADFPTLTQGLVQRGVPSTAAQLTHQGMKVLAGLNPAKFAVLPFHDASAESCSVIETFPRATLWCLDLPHVSYRSKEKKDTDKVQAQRRDIIKQLLELRERKGVTCKDCPRLTIDKSLQFQAVESAEALDAVISCYTTAIWLASPFLFGDPYDCDNENVLLEGWIYAPTKIKK